MRARAARAARPAVAVVTRAAGWRCAGRPLAQLCAAVLAAEGAATRWLSVALVDDREMRALNRRYHGVDGATDVLAFPLRSGPGDHPLLGEVVLSVDTAAREAKARRLPLAREVALYAVHGTLHLLGYDDHAPAARARMRRRERRALAAPEARAALRTPPRRRRA